jgi:HEAT repeat protein
VDPLALESEPLTPDTEQLARELAEYTPGELEELRVIGESGAESDIQQAAVRTLLFAMPFVQHPDGRPATGKELALFSGVARQLEGMASHFLKTKDFQMAMIILRAFRSVPLPLAFQPRVQEAVRRISSREIIDSLIAALRANPKTSPKYEEAFRLLEQLSQEATPVLLEALAAEQERMARLFYLELLKEFGREQIGLIAEGLSDHRWFVVRNIVNILAESKSEQAISFLEKVVDHKNQQVRQEVIRGLITIGGKRAAVLLTRYLKDKDRDVQFAALRALGMVQGAGTAEELALLDFLELRRFTSREQENEITQEAVRTLGKIGGPDAGAFLRRYERIRWWRSRKLQLALRAVAREAAAEIAARKGDAGRTRY